MKKVSWLFLHCWIPQRDLRRRFYCYYLTPLDRLMIKAAHGCYTRVLEEHLAWAIDEDHFYVFQWLYTRRHVTKLHRWLVSFAFRRSRLDVLDDLWRNGEIATARDMCGVYFAAFNGDLQLLDWALQTKIPLDGWLISAGAVHGGKPNVLEWAALHHVRVSDDCGNFYLVGRRKRRRL
jgi:hypothetical protein